jgi:hypothetical protein
VALLDALRAVTEFEPPGELPPCDLAELADVLEAHGLAALASYQIESRPIGAQLPLAFRERLLTLYQGIVNDNAFRMLTLRGVLKEIDVPVVLLGGAAYLDWIYPHLAFRPLGELRLGVRGADGARFLEGAARAGFRPSGTGPGGHTATFTDGRIEIAIQEGLVEGSGADLGLFERRRPYPALGPSAARPAAEVALLATVADQACLGLFAPLYTFVDLRELMRLEPPLDAADIGARSAEAGLQRALHGALQLAAHFFPAVSERARSLMPPLPRAERIAVDAVVESAKDPAKLRRLRGSEAAAKLVVAPRGA